MPREQTGKTYKGARLGLVLRLLVVVVMAGLLLAASLVFFRVKRVTVTGSVRYNATELEQAAAIEHDSWLFSLPVEQIKTTLLQAYPYIKDIEVKRKLPDTVELALTECRPIAYIDQGGRRWIVDTDGKLLEVVTTDVDTGCFEVRGVTLDTPVVNTFFLSPESGEVQKQTYESLLAELLHYEFLGTIDYIDLTSIAGIEFSVQGKYVVRVGVVSDLAYKMQLLESVLIELAEGKSNLKGTISLVDCVQTRRAIFTEDLE